MVNAVPLLKNSDPVFIDALETTVEDLATNGDVIAVSSDVDYVDFPRSERTIAADENL